jgi:hypothetical protein
MRALMMLLMTLTLVSCDDTQKGTFSVTESFLPTPTPPVGLQIFPQALPAVPVSTVACPLGQSFTIPFNLVIVSSQSDVSMDLVTVRLIDGSNIGGPEITFPRAGLNNMFGSTTVIRTSTFSFTPVFGCTATQPEVIVADVVLTDRTGSSRSLTASAKLR